MSSAEDELPADPMPLITALGLEIRAARAARGWTRGDLVEHLPGDLHVQTIAGYEQGVRACTVERLIEICDAMSASPQDVLARTLRRVGRTTRFVDSSALAVARTRVTDAALLLRLASSDLATAEPPPE